MDPVSRLDHNFIYLGPDASIGDLSTRVDGQDTYSHWKPTEEELQALNDGGVIELKLSGHPISPVAITAVNDDVPTVEAPFKTPWEVEGKRWVGQESAGLLLVDEDEDLIDNEAPKPEPEDD